MHAAMPAKEPSKQPARHLPRLGRPPSGRKTVLQIALDEAAIGQIEKIAAHSGGTLSSTGRVLILEALTARAKKDKGK